MKKIVTTACLILLMLLLLSTTLVTNAASRLYAGTEKLGDFYGIKASITAPSYKSDFGDTGAAWVGMDDQTTVWIQTGFIHKPENYNFVTYYETYNSGNHHLTDVGLHLFGEPVDYRVEYDSSAEQWKAYISNTCVGSLSSHNKSAKVSAVAEFFSADKKLLPINFSNVMYKNKKTWRYMNNAPYNDAPYVATYSGTIYCNYTIQGGN